MGLIMMGLGATCRRYTNCTKSNSLAKIRYFVPLTDKLLIENLALPYYAVGAACRQTLNIILGAK